ncbi:hypothetical protein [Leptospira noguchii]|nr:hypothetical protein [Leptospira noguchii]
MFWISLDGTTQWVAFDQNQKNPAKERIHRIFGVLRWGEYRDARR